LGQFVDIDFGFLIAFFDLIGDIEEGINAAP